MPSNKLLPIFAVVMLAMLIFVGLKASGRGEPKNLALPAVPVAPHPDADSPADTLRTLTAYVADLKAESASIAQQNKALLGQKADIESQLKAMLLDELRKQQVSPSAEMSSLTAQVQSLQERLSQPVPLPTPTLGTQPPGSFLPVNNSSVSTAPAPETLQWVEPLGATTSIAISDVNGLGAPVAKDATTLLVATPVPAPLLPVYTVPRNATLIGSTAMTALIGKIPFKDTISDPFPFKVIVGTSNLAANGIDMPGLDGMVFSGHTSGDWTLGCVRGNVESVTFVFEDGTIRTLSGNSQNGKDSNGSGGSVNNFLATGSGGGGNTAQNTAIGWISDKRGIPCVSGERISNAATYLGGRVLAKAAESAAKAFGQRNVTNSVSPLGGVFSTITGDAAQYAGLNALAGGADELSQYIRDRGAQSFDVVYVDTGVEVAVHIDRELPIDYEPNGRKTSYATVKNTQTIGLD